VRERGELQARPSFRDVDLEDHADAGGVELLLVGVGLAGLASAVLTYVLKHAPPTMWGDDTDL